MIMFKIKSQKFTIVAVSYTHLDVYKRQAYYGEEKQPEAIGGTEEDLCSILMLTGQKKKNT